MNIFFNIKIILYIFYILYKLKEEKHINNKIKKILFNDIKLVPLRLEYTNLLYKNKLYY